MLVTVIRHAESLGNAGMLRENDPDPLLSPLGIDQARLAAKRLAAEGVTHIWSSPFRRAIQTASYLARARQIEVLLEPDMVEHYIFDDLKDYRGRTGRELLTEFEFATLAGHFRGGRWTPEWGESWEGLLERTGRVARRALELARKSANPEAVHLAVFGHGASVKALLTTLIGEAIPSDAPFVNAGMSRARLDDSLPGKALFLNDASHLDVLEEAR